MARPKIRHLAIFARNPRALAEFYRDVLEMEIINSEPDGSAFFVSDGYLTLGAAPASSRRLSAGRDQPFRFRGRRRSRDLQALCGTRTRATETPRRRSALRGISRRRPGRKLVRPLGARLRGGRNEGGSRPAQSAGVKRSRLRSVGDARLIRRARSFGPALPASSQLVAVSYGLWHAVVRRCSDAQPPPGNGRTQSWHDARPAHDRPPCGVWRPRDGVWQRFRNVVLLVRDARKSSSCSPGTILAHERVP